MSDLLPYRSIGDGAPLLLVGTGVAPRDGWPSAAVAAQMANAEVYLLQPDILAFVDWSR